MAVVSVVFDVGETLLDDTREYGAWADWLGVPRHTFSAVLGAVTAAGRNNAETFQYFRPGFDLDAERERREATGAGELTARLTCTPMSARCCRHCGRWASGWESPGTRPRRQGASCAQ